MDSDVTNPSSLKAKESVAVVAPKVEVIADNEECEESNSLLTPKRGGGAPKLPKNSQRKVQWNDRNGNNLVEVLEFQPSDTSDSEDDDSDTCNCTIM